MAQEFIADTVGFFLWKKIQADAVKAAAKFPAIHANATWISPLSIQRVTQVIMVTA